MERPKNEKALPIVLSEEEVSLILRTVTNLKHKAILMIIYSGGLRIGELINLKIEDIDSLLSTKMLDILRTCFKHYQPKTYLFEGQNGQQYSVRSIQSFFKEICKKQE